MKTILFALLMVLCAAPVHALTGRWVTQSENLEIEIAPCGDALCGTAVKVLGNRSMANPDVDMPNPPPTLGLKVLRDLTPDGENRWYGHIYNRENGKTYRCRMTLLESGDLEIRPYLGLPIFGKTQIWRRAFD